jgi:hypothetical protein
MTHFSQVFSALIGKITGYISTARQRLFDLAKQAAADREHPRRLRKEVTSIILVIESRGLQQNAAGIRCDQRMVSGGKLSVGFQFIFPAAG